MNWRLFFMVWEVRYIILDKVYVESGIFVNLELIFFWNDGR